MGQLRTEPSKNSMVQISMVEKSQSTLHKIAHAVLDPAAVAAVRAPRAMAAAFLLVATPAAGAAAVVGVDPLAVAHATAVVVPVTADAGDVAVAANAAGAHATTTTTIELLNRQREGRMTIADHPR